MNEQSKREAQAPEADQGQQQAAARVGSRRGPAGQLEPNEGVTKRFEALELALDGVSEAEAARTITVSWSGIDETDVLFKSIKDALRKAEPPDRPILQLRDTYDTPQSGG